MVLFQKLRAETNVYISYSFTVANDTFQDLKKWLEFWKPEFPNTLIFLLRSMVIWIFFVLYNKICLVLANLYKSVINDVIYACICKYLLKFKINQWILMSHGIKQFYTVSDSTLQMLKIREQAQNEVPYVKPQVTKSRLNYSSSSPRNGILNQWVRNHRIPSR